MDFIKEEISKGTADLYYLSINRRVVIKWIMKI